MKWKYPKYIVSLFERYWIDWILVTDSGPKSLRWVCGVWLRLQQRPPGYRRIWKLWQAKKDTDISSYCILLTIPALKPFETISTIYSSILMILNRLNHSDRLGPRLPQNQFRPVRAPNASGVYGFDTECSKKYLQDMTCYSLYLRYLVQSGMSQILKTVSGPDSGPDCPKTNSGPDSGPECLMMPQMCMALTSQDTFRIWTAMKRFEGHTTSKNENWQEN